jgi:hypothetical protein
MLVIVNNQTPLTVKDNKGNVLFQYLPQEVKFTFTPKDEKVLNHDELKEMLDKMNLYY